MLRLVIFRTCISLATLLMVAVVTFSLMHSVPGGPFSAERSLAPEIEQRLNERYGLDRPAREQFFRWCAGLLRGDLGPSFTKPDRTANEIVRDGFPVSAALGLAALLIAVAVGVPMAVLGALRSHGWVDRILLLVATLGVSVPSFIIASLLQYVVAYKWGLAPPAGWGDSLRQMVLPALALAAFPTAFLSRLVRSTLLECMGQDWMRTAQAKGLSRSAALLRHALRLALVPAVAYAGPLLAGLVTGSFVVETIFAVPGLGSFYVTSVGDRDYTVIMSVTMLYATLLVTCNAVADVAATALDPRTRK